VVLTTCHRSQIDALFSRTSTDSNVGASEARDAFAFAFAFAFDLVLLFMRDSPDTTKRDLGAG
jgi:hypothetical protein